MAYFPVRADFLNAAKFSPADVLHGVSPSKAIVSRPGFLRVFADGAPEDACFFGREGPGDAAPLIWLDGDLSKRVDGVWSVDDFYAEQSPLSVQVWAEQVSISLNRTFVALGRPGTFGSSGNHQERRRRREVVIVSEVLTALKAAFGWKVLDIAGFSGGGHLVAALLAEREDIGCAVIASGNVSVAKRNATLGWTCDVTGFNDFIDPVDLAVRVAADPPRRLIVLTDPEDRIVPASCQVHYVERLRDFGVRVDHRTLSALDYGHHDLRNCALLAAAANAWRAGN